MNPTRALVCFGALLLAAAGLARIGLHDAPHTVRSASPGPLATAPSACATSPHVALGVPVDADPSDDHLICRPQYVVSYNPTKLAPNWASWELEAARLGGTPRHRGHFLTDASLPAGWYRVTHADYTDSGYDRGHLVPSDDRTHDRSDNDATFYLTNIAPQTHALNGGPWAALEERCRHLVQGEHKGLYIAAGPLFAAKPSTLGPGIAVPRAFWKIVVVLGDGQGPADVRPETRVIAVVMPNVESVAGEPWTGYRTTVSEVERQSGYRFFDQIPEPVRAVLKSRLDAGP
jgi:endonuclease G